MRYLTQIDSPSDVKKLDLPALNTLAGEMRTALLEKASRRGGHVGPNLGMVEATIALHYVFNSPEDKIVYDISHQSYPHKMLTGRKASFLDPERYADITGYSSPEESAHDFFTLGHTSTSVSLASGLAKGRDLTGGTENIIAVLGDGSLSGGEALEGLDFVAGELDSNFILVLNDNQMSIAENHGGIYAHLEELRATRGASSNNFFRAMGFDYLYVHEGHNLELLIEAFAKVKDIDHPVVVHINTLKGCGYTPAIERKEAFHYSAPFDIATGERIERQSAGIDYGSLTADYLLEKMAQDPSVVAITAGTPGMIGFTPEKRAKAGRQYVDVGIAEEHAVAMASGIAKRGAKAVFGVYSTFVQRTYDQLSQDLAINGNPATILVFGGSLSTMNDVTHLCLYDIPMISNIPGLLMLAPSNASEYLSMLDWSIRQEETPVVIRVPVGEVSLGKVDYMADYSLPCLRNITVRQGRQVAIIGVGSFMSKALEVADTLKVEYNIEATVINPLYISALDAKTLDGLLPEHALVLTLEDGSIEGGYGEKIARHYGPTTMRVLCRGVRKEFMDGFSLSEELERNRLETRQIVTDTMELLSKISEPTQS